MCHTDGHGTEQEQVVCVQLQMVHLRSILTSSRVGEGNQGIKRLVGIESLACENGLLGVYSGRRGVGLQGVGIGEEIQVADLVIKGFKGLLGELGDTIGSLGAGVEFHVEASEYGGERGAVAEVHHMIFKSRLYLGHRGGRACNNQTSLRQ